MKLLLLLGVLVLLEIGTCTDAKKEKSRVKRGPTFHEHAAEHDDHTIGRLNEHRSSRNGRQEKFQRYLKDWEKFSDPQKKWHKSDLKKKTHDKRKPAEKKDDKRHPEELKHIKLSHENGHEKKINPFTLKANKRREYLRERFARKRQNRRGDKNQWKRKMYKQRYHNDKRRKHMSFDKKSDLKLKDKLHHKMEIKDRTITSPGHHEFHRGTSHPGRQNNRRDNKSHNDFCKRLEKRECKKDVKREICGNDGKTHENRCLYHKAVCKKGLTDPKSLSYKRGACEGRKIIQ